MQLATLLLGVLAVASAAPTYDSHWNNFKKIYGKVYENVVEETYRRNIFEKNLEKILDHNSLYLAGLKTFSMKINSHTDKMFEEVVRPGCLTEAPNGLPSVSIPPGLGELPKSVDWRNHPGVVSEVKKQGLCGSCYAFSATGAVEGQVMLSLNKSVSLSEQQLIDCAEKETEYCDGCDSGTMIGAYMSISRLGGIENEETYPYEAKKGYCRFNKSKAEATVYKYSKVTPRTEALQEVVAMKGPVSVGIAATDDFSFYHGGIYEDEYCSSIQLNHAVLVVGYGTERVNGEDVDYWIVKNSWGPDYGENGYIRMRKGRNMCGILNFATIPKVKLN